MRLGRNFHQNAYKAGVRDGIRSVLRGGSYRAAPPMIRKGIGSIATDRRERHGDMDRFRGDVDRHRAAVVEQ